MTLRPEKLLPGDFIQSHTPALQLPEERNPLVGRESEMGEIIHLLSDPSHHLLTLVGPGGVGKTRLAAQVARESQGRFADGVFFVSLVSVSSSDFLASAIATSLRLIFFGQDDMKKQVMNYLRDKEALLVLDNFEHLLDEADWIAKIREEAPRVKFIVTSRESLGQKGEKIFEVRGLRVPSDESASDIESYGAVRLFLEEARKAHPDFQLAEDQKPHLVYLCRFLEGMPLGLELAAAWVKSLPIAEIYSQIRKNRDFLAASYGDLPERHRSLRSVFEYSWNMLGPSQKEIFQKLAVFQGGFRPEAAESVAGAAVTNLALLADKSVLRKSANGRYEMHSLLRQYADEKLEETPSLREEVRQRHCAYYAGLLQGRTELLFSARQKEAMGEISVESENIRLAWFWALEKRAFNEVEKMVETLFFYYDLHGLYQEGEKVFGRGVQSLQGEAGAEGSAAPKALRALYGDLMARQGRFFYRLGHNEKAAELLRASLGILNRVGSEKQVAFAVNHLSFVLSLVSGDFQEARKLLEQSVEACEKSNDRPGLALSLKNLGYIHWRLGKYTEARQFLHRSENLFTELGDSHSLSIVLTEIVNLAFDQSRYEEAEELCVRSLTVQKEIGNRGGIAWTEGKLGNIHWVLGNFGPSQRFYDQSLKIFRETGDLEGMAWATNSLGHSLRSLGNSRWALECYKQGLVFYQKLNHRWGTAWSLANGGQLECLLGHLDEAEKALRESLAVFKEIGNPWGTSLALDGLGRTALGRQQPKEALSFFEEGLALLRKSGNQREMGLALCGIGQVFLAEKELLKARQNLVEALKIEMEIYAVPVVLRVLAVLCFLGAEKGDAESAFTLGTFVRNHTSTEWEVRNQLEDFLIKWRQAIGPDKAALIQDGTQNLQLKEVVEGVLKS